VLDGQLVERIALAQPRLIGATIAENPDWVLKAVRLHGQEVTDTPIEFAPWQTVEGFEVVFSRKRTDLSGMLADECDRALTDATVIAFAVDSRRWGFQSRFVRTARPNQEGRYNLRGLPPED
jgi:hypothetical protein